MCFDTHRWRRRSGDASTAATSRSTPSETAKGGKPIVKILVLLMEITRYEILATRSLQLARGRDWRWLKTSIRIIGYGYSEILREYLWQSYVNCELVARSRLAGWANVEIELRSVQIEPAPDTLEDNPLFATASLAVMGSFDPTLYTNTQMLLKKKKEKRAKRKRGEKKNKKKRSK